MANTKKTSTSSKSNNKKTSKKTTQKKSPVKRGKVSVSPGGLIFLCGGIIIFCLVLLLVTTIVERRPEVDSQFTTENIQTDKSKGKTPETKKTDTPEQAKKPKESVKETAKVTTKESPKSSPKTSSPATKEKTPESNTPKREEPKQAPVPKPENKTESKIENKVQQTDTIRSENSQVKTDTEKTKEASNKKSFDFPKAVGNAQLCLLLDDGGQNLSDLQKFLALKIPVTVAVLPKLRDSVSSAKAVRASGHGELMLHQPMQAVNLNVNPGPGAIKPDMSSSEIRNLVLENLREIGPVSGMNNHEGSLITADATKMETIIDVAHMQGIYFLDSRTNVETKIPYVSRELGYGWYERNGYFLDNQKTRDEFLKELRKNLDIANKTGCVIMIAHVWSADYMPALIREVYPELVAKGYSFTTVGKSRGLKN